MPHTGGTALTKHTQKMLQLKQYLKKALSYIKIQDMSIQTVYSTSRVCTTYEKSHKSLKHTMEFRI